LPLSASLSGHPTLTKTPRIRPLSDACDGLSILRALSYKSALTYLLISITCSGTLIIFRQIMSTLTAQNICAWTMVGGTWYTYITQNKVPYSDDPMTIIKQVLTDAKTLCGQGYYVTNMHWMSLLANLWVYSCCELSCTDTVSDSSLRSW
jgi:hypothetical protein